MASRIHLEKATREGSILFPLEGDLESKFVNPVVMLDISNLITSIFFLASSSRCAIHLFTLAAKR